jgi:hypothetical protein
MNRPNPLSEYLNNSPRSTRRELLTAGIAIFGALGTIEYGFLSKDGHNTELLLGRDPTEYFDGELKFKYEDLIIYDESGEQYPHETILAVNNLSGVQSGKYTITNPLITESPRNQSQKSIRLNLKTSLEFKDQAVGYAPLWQFRELNAAQFDTGEFKKIQVDTSGHIIEDSERVSGEKEASFGKINPVVETKSHPDNTEPA